MGEPTMSSIAPIALAAQTWDAGSAGF